MDKAKSYLPDFLAQFGSRSSDSGELIKAKMTKTKPGIHNFWSWFLQGSEAACWTIYEEAHQVSYLWVHLDAHYPGKHFQLSRIVLSGENYRLRENYVEPKIKLKCILYYTSVGQKRHYLKFIIFNIFIINLFYYF